MKRGVVRCLQPHPHRKETDKSNSDKSNSDKRQKEKRPLVVIPYVAGMSEDIKCVCKKFNIRVVFKSE